MKKQISILLFSSLLGSIFYLIFGWIIFDLILGSYTDEHTTQLIGFKKTQDFSLLFLYLSCLAYSGLLNFILFHSTISSIGKAFSFSAIVGVLIACMTDFYWYASTHFYSDFFVVSADILGAALTVGALGWFSFFFQQKSQIR